jgi:hypothetical protein
MHKVNDRIPGEGERYVSPFPPVTPRERELLQILAEECSEVAVRISKMLRFGRDESNPATGVTNKLELSKEVGDLCAMVDMCENAGLIDTAEVIAALERKLKKVPQYLQSEPEAPAETAMRDMTEDEVISGDLARRVSHD